jgi:acylphosphatase
VEELIRTEQVIFHGSVQGVGFRYLCNKLAKELALSGWVRNLQDGTVEAVLQGDQEMVRQLLEKLMIGPGRIRVTEASQRKVELPAIKGFSVR